MTEAESLILYVRDYCGFCYRVMRTIKRLGLEIEIRNIWQSGEADQELVQATGRRTVPVLKITDAAGQTRWMPESGDIIRYLEDRFAST